MTRGLSSAFLDAMRSKLEHGRMNGYVGWDQRWDCYWNEEPTGPTGFLMRRLLAEVLELALAVEQKDENEIISEAADVANFAMMIADIHCSGRIEVSDDG